MKGSIRYYESGIVVSNPTYNLELRKEVIESGYLDKFMALKKKLYDLINDENQNPSMIDAATGELLFYLDFFRRANHPNQVLDCCARLYDTKYNKLNTIESKVTEMLERGPDVYWLYLSFNDYVLSITTYDERRTIVKTFLYSLGLNFVGNVDYGDDDYYVSYKGDVRKGTKREHYHFIIDKEIDLSFWPFGKITTIAKIGRTEEDKLRVFEYLAIAAVLSIVNAGDNRLVSSKSYTPLLSSGLTIVNRVISQINNNNLSLSYSLIDKINNTISNKQHPIYHDMY